MQWIETLFGLSPDGGSGATEMLLVLLVVVPVAAIVVWRRSVAREGRHGQR